MAKGAFGAQVELKGAGSGAGTPSTGITGLSSRQVLFGSSAGGVAQDLFMQYDSTLGALGLGSSAPLARFYAIPPADASLNSFGWATTNGVQSGVINSSGHIGIGTTAPTVPLHVVSPAQAAIFQMGSTVLVTLDYVATVSSGARIAFLTTNQASWTRGQIEAQPLLINAQSPGPVGVGTTIANAKLHVRTTASQNVLLITGTTDGTQPAFCIESTGSTSKLGFWTTAGSTRQPAYATTGTTSRTMNSTITPAAVYSSDVGAQVNVLQGVVKSLIQDLVAYGLSPTTV